MDNMKIIRNIKVIAFDADDTLWINEPYFQQIEDRFCELLEDYLPHHTIKRASFLLVMIVVIDGN